MNERLMQNALAFGPESMRPRHIPDEGYPNFDLGAKVRGSVESAGKRLEGVIGVANNHLPMRINVNDGNIRNLVSNTVKTFTKPEVIVPALLLSSLAFQGDTTATMDSLIKWSELSVPLTIVGGAAVGGIKHMWWRSQNLGENAPIFSSAVIREAVEWGAAGGLLASAGHAFLTATPADVTEGWRVLNFTKVALGGVSAFFALSSKL